VVHAFRRGSRVVDVMTLATYTHGWLRVAPTRYRRQTVIAYRSALLRHVLPTLGDIPLPELTRSRIRALLVEQLGKGFAPRGVRSMLVALSTVLTAAVDDELIETNAAHGAARRLRLRQARNPGRAVRRGARAVL